MLVALAVVGTLPITTQAVLTRSTTGDFSVFAIRTLPHRETTDQLRKQILKGTRWLLLKRSADLDPQRRERQRLKEALRLNESLATAYDLKKDLAQVWQQTGKFSARIVLDHWIADAESNGIRQLMKFARTLQTRREGIVNWYDHPISTGPLEGTNNKIKLLQREAYGSRVSRSSSSNSSHYTTLSTY